MISTIVNSCKSKGSHFACGFNDDCLYQLFVAGGSAISVEMENKKGLVDRISVKKNRLDDLAGLMVLSESGEANASSSPTFSQKGWNLVMDLWYPALLHCYPSRIAGFSSCSKAFHCECHCNWPQGLLKHFDKMPSARGNRCWSCWVFTVRSYPGLPSRWGGPPSWCLWPLSESDVFEPVVTVIHCPQFRNVELVLHVRRMAWEYNCLGDDWVDYLREAFQQSMEKPGGIGLLGFMPI